MYEQVIVGEAVAGEAESTRKALENLINTINRSTFDVADLLHKVKKNGFYKNYGFNTFLEYVEGLELKTRKAQYLTKMVDTMEQVKLPREVYEPVGIAKLREITSLDVINEDGDPATYEDPDSGDSHLMSDIIKGLVDKAPEMSLEELKQYVRVLKGFVGYNDTTWLNICVNRQALEQSIEPAFQLAKKVLGTAKTDDEGVAQDYSDGKALEMLAVEFINDPANSVLGGENVSQTEVVGSENQ